MKRATSVLAIAGAAVFAELAFVVRLGWHDLQITATVLGLYSAVLLAALGPAAFAVVAVRSPRGSAFSDTTVRIAAVVTLAAAVEVLVVLTWRAGVPDAEVRSRTFELWCGPILTGVALMPALSHVVFDGQQGGGDGLVRDTVISAVAAGAVLLFALS